MEERALEKVGEKEYGDACSMNLSLTASLLLGPVGRITHRSRKSGGPKSIFNANIFNSIAEKIWYGDLELAWAHDIVALTTLSRTEGPLYILNEFDGRHLREAPTAAYVKAAAAVKVEDGRIVFSKKQKKRMKHPEQRKSRILSPVPCLEGGLP